MDISDLRTQLAELHPLSFGWALNCCGGDPSLAEDVLQIACVKALEGRAKFRGGNASCKTWFFGVIRNTAREERRRILFRRIKLVDYEPNREEADSNPALSLQQSERAREIRAHLNRLSHRQREVLHLVFYQEMTVEEAAAVMEISIGSARTHYARGKTRLREWLEKDHEKS